MAVRKFGERTGGVRMRGMYRETIAKWMHECGWTEVQMNLILRLMWRGWGCQRLEECYNASMLADKGDLEW